MLRPQNTLLSLQSLLQKQFGAWIESEVTVHVSHNEHHLRPELRVLRQAGINVLRSFIQNFPRSNTVAARFARTRLFEHTGHELGDAARSVALSCRAPQLHRLQDRKSSEHKHECCRHSRPHTMPPDIFLQA